MSFGNGVGANGTQSLRLYIIDPNGGSPVNSSLAPCPLISLVSAPA
jgi:hypothetical protein